MRYTVTAVILHWSMALLLIGLLAMGLYMTGLPFSPQRLKLFNWHKWAGMLVLGLASFRLFWRLTHSMPQRVVDIHSSMQGWQRRIHRCVHLALYVMFFIIPLLGWAYSSASGFPVVLFGIISLPDLVPVNKALAEALKQSHHYAAYAMTCLVILHIGAALKHHFIDHDRLLNVMWFGSRHGSPNRY